MSVKIVFSKPSMIVYIIILVLFCSIVLYAINRDAEVLFSKDKWLIITPKNNRTIKELQSQLDKSVPLADYNKLLAKYKEINKEHSDSLSKVQLLTLQVNTFETDTNYSFTFLDTELNRVGMINTKRPVDNETIQTRYKHIQKCLSTIGSYDGSCDGGQISTCNAVMEFQSNNGLKVDAVIGKNTWGAIKAIFEKEKLNY